MAIEYVDSTQLDSDLTSVADAIRAKSGGSSQLAFPAGFVSEIQAIPSGGGGWVRPSGWPDIDSLVPWDSESFADFDGFFCTFDNSGGHFPVAGFWCVTNSGTYTVERGRITNGAFVSDASTAVNSNSAFTENYADCGYDYPIYYVHATTGHLTTCGFRSVGNVTATKASCVEIVGHIGHVTSIGGGSSNNQLNSECIVRSHLVFGDKEVVTSLNSCWYNMYSLEELDLSYFDTSNWAVTTLAGCFNGCSSLLKLDLSGWDTHNWAVTNMGYCFYGLGSLREIDLSGWDTSGFNLTSFQYVFNAANVIIAKISALKYSGTGSITYINSRRLTDLYPMSLSTNLNYGNCINLTHDSLLRILNSLPVGAYTLTLGALNKSRLTQDEIAIATDKGWTVA